MGTQLNNQLQFEKGGKALYIQIKDIYRRKILSGELQPGDKIESEQEIQKLFGVSRITARQAILDLEKEGMVNRGRGRGTFVTWKPAVESPPDIQSFSREMQCRGKMAGTVSVEFCREEVAPSLLKLFNLQHDEMLYCFKKVRMSNDIRLCFTKTYYPPDTEIHIEQETLNGMIQETPRVAEFRKGRVDEEFIAQLPTEEVQQALRIPVNMPILTRKRYAYDTEGSLKEFTVSYYRGDLYTYKQSGMFVM